MFIANLQPFKLGCRQSGISHQLSVGPFITMRVQRDGVALGGNLQETAMLYSLLTARAEAQPNDPAFQVEIALLCALVSLW